MDHLGIDRAVLVGLSMGGRVAIDMALEEPTVFKAVVAVSSGLGGYRFVSDFHLENRKPMIAAWKSGDFDAVVEAFQREWTDGPHRQPEDVDPQVRERVRAMARHTVESVMEGRSLQPPAIERLAELELPMLVVVGELDMPGIHEIADLLVEANPHAELVKIPGVAHMVNLEAPEEFDRCCWNFSRNSDRPCALRPRRIAGRYGVQDAGVLSRAQHGSHSPQAQADTRLSLA